MFTFLAAHLNDTTAREAAEGWNGDSYVLYSGNNSFNWQWKIAWDSESDAREFYNVSRNMLGELGTYKDGVWLISENYLDQEVKIALNGTKVVLKGKSWETTPYNMVMNIQSVEIKPKFFPAQNVNCQFFYSKDGRVHKGCPLNTNTTSNGCNKV